MATASLDFGGIITRNTRRWNAASAQDADLYRLMTDD
jgi:hypothetical protein